jgi:hypothetical protein
MAPDAHRLNGTAMVGTVPHHGYSVIGVALIGLTIWYSCKNIRCDKITPHKLGSSARALIDETVAGMRQAANAGDTSEECSDAQCRSTCDRCWCTLFAFLAVACTFTAAVIWTAISGKCLRGEDCRSPKDAHIAAISLFWGGLVFAVISIALFVCRVQESLDGDDYAALFRVLQRISPRDHRLREQVYRLLMHDLPQQG